MDTTTGAAARQRTPRPKPQRRIRIEVRPEHNGLGIVRITVGTEHADYFLTELPADFGRGFRVEKIGLHENDRPTTSTSTGPATPAPAATCRGCRCGPR